MAKSKVSSMYEGMYDGLDLLPLDTIENPDFPGVEDKRIPADKIRIRAALDNLNKPFTEDRTFESIYEDFERNMQNIMEMLARYKDHYARLEQECKILRAVADIRLGKEKNPETGKPFNRDTVKAMVEEDTEVVKNVDLQLDAKQNIRYLEYLYKIYEYHHERIVNTNINARRVMQNTY